MDFSSMLTNKNYEDSKKYNLFISMLRNKYGQLMVNLFYDLKHLNKTITKLERRNYLCQFFIKYNLLPKTSKLINGKLNNKYRTKIQELEWKLFMQDFKEIKALLFKNKSKLHHFIDLAFNRLIEPDRILLIEWLNKYKRFLDTKNFKQINKKINFLIKKVDLKGFTPASDKDNQTSLNCFINRTDVVVPNVIHNLLENGPKHTINVSGRMENDMINKINTEYIMQEIIKEELQVYDGNIKDLSKTQLNSLRQFMASTMNNKWDDSNNSEIKLLKMLKDFLIINNLVIVEADKSHTLILIDKTYYLKGMEEALLANNFIEVYVNNTETIERKVQEICRRLKVAHFLDEFEYKKIYPSGTPEPTIQGKLKIHKEQEVFRPLVNASRSCIKGLSQWIMTIINKYCDLSSVVKNAAALKDSLSKIQIKKQYYMVSYDAVNMFSNIDVKTVTNYILSRFKFDKAKVKKIDLDLLETILNLSTKGTISVFEDKIYKQTSGIGMGLPISSLYANIYMAILEKGFLKDKKMGIIRYARFMDDIFVLLESKENANIMLNKLNSLSTTLKFTMEEEINGRLDFMDLTILRKESNLEFDVFHKSSKNNVRMNFGADYQRHVIKNSLKQEIIRGYRLCSNEKSLANELNYIRKIYVDNDYPIKFINDCIKDINVKFTKNFGVLKPENENNKNFTDRRLVIEHGNNFHQMKSAFNTVKKDISWKEIDDMVLVEKGPKSLLSIIKPIGKKGNNKDKLNNVVYQFSCSCGWEYIGCTTRNGYLRKKEHLKDKNSAINRHLIEFPNHFIIKDNNYNILYKNDNKLKLHIAESLLIIDKSPKLNLEKGLNLISHTI